MKKTQGLFEQVEAILIEAHARAKRTAPVAGDVRRNMRLHGGLRELVEVVGREKAIELYVYAWQTWKNGCSWESVLAQRDRLMRELAGVKPLNPERLESRKAPVVGVDYYMKVVEGVGRYFKLVGGVRTEERFIESEWRKERGL